MNVLDKLFRFDELLDNISCKVGTLDFKYHYKGSKERMFTGWYKNLLSSIESSGECTNKLHQDRIHATTYRVIGKIALWININGIDAEIAAPSFQYLYLKYKSKDNRVSVINGVVFFDNIKVSRCADFSEITHSTQ